MSDIIKSNEPFLTEDQIEQSLREGKEKTIQLANRWQIEKFRERLSDVVLALRSKQPWINLLEELPDVEEAFPGKDLRGAPLNNLDLSGVDLREAVLNYANFQDSNLKNVDFRGAYLSGVNLSEANLAGANFSGCMISSVNLSGANLSGAQLADTNFLGANLRKANFSQANLENASFFGAKLEGAIFTNAILKNNRFGNFAREDIHYLYTRWDLDIWQARYNQIISALSSQQEWAHLISGLPHIQDIPNGRDLRGMGGDNLNLNQIDFQDTDLSFSTFEYSSFQDCNFQGAGLIEVNLSYSSLVRSNFSGCNMTGAVLAMADFSQANLVGVSFAGANLIGANFSGADLTNADLSQANIQCAIFENAKL